jgi:drug/metabolite transporter (DMT)-like permease
MRAGQDGLVAANRRGILCMAGAMSCFVVNDAFVKYVSQSVPIAQMVFVRSVFVTFIILAIARSTGATARIGDAARPRVLVRAVIDASATLMYLAALVHLPIANATAINLAAPLFMTVLAVVFLREQVDLARWLAIVAGFVGVVLIIQPRAAGFNAWAVLILAATLLHAIRDLLTRGIPRGIPSILITSAATVTASVMSGIWTLTQGWRPIGGAELLLVGCAAVFVSAGFYLIVASMRQGEMSVIGPFRYTGLLVALVLGFTVWGDIPNPLAWAGILLMLASGIYILVGERRRARSER